MNANPENGAAVRPGWTAGEEALLRGVLDRAQRDLPVGPAPWPALQRRRRQTTIRRAVLATAVAASVALVAGALVALDAWPGLQGERTQVAGLTQDGEPVGNLAADPAFLAGVRDRAASELASQGDGAGPVRGAIKVLVATDVTGGRMALVSVRSYGRRAQGWWLSGGDHAPASRMYLTDSCDLSGPCWTRYGNGPGSVPDRKPDGTVVPPSSVGQGVIVVGPRGARVLVQSGNDVTATGQVRPDRVAADERWAGVYVAPLATVDGRQDVTVTVPGARPWQDWSFIGSSLDDDFWWKQASAGTGSDQPVSGSQQRGDLLSVAQRTVGMRARGGDRVFWQSSDNGTDRAVLAFRGRSGGWALVAVHRVTRSTDAVELGVDGVRVLPGGDPTDPAAGLDRVCLAWRPPNPDGSRTLVVLGPSTATRARLVVPGQPADRHALTLDRGAGSVTDLPAVSQVQLLGATGQESARCDVSKPWKDGDLLR
jgi:hypothetical protein